MKPLDRAEVEQIIKQAKPGFRVIDENGASKMLGDDALLDDIPVEDQTPDIETLRRMYLGSDEEAARGRRQRRRHADGPPADGPNGALDEVQVVLIGADDVDTAINPGPGAKTLLISRRTGRIRAQQG